MNAYKIKEYIFLFMTWLFAYFAPIVPFILMVGCFIISDTITAIIAVVKKQGWQGVKSRRLRDTVFKFTAYSIGLLSAYTFQVKFFIDFPALKLIAGYIAMSELKSIDENIAKITGHSLFSSLIKQFKKS